MFRDNLSPVWIGPIFVVCVSLCWLSACCVDNDGDGFTGYHEVLCPEGLDCDDNLATVHPEAPELCDGIDNQCPGDVGYGELDEGCERIVFATESLYAGGEVSGLAGADAKCQFQAEAAGLGFSLINSDNVIVDIYISNNLSRAAVKTRINVLEVKCAVSVVLILEAVLVLLVGKITQTPGCSIRHKCFTAVKT